MELHPSCFEWSKCDGLLFLCTAAVQCRTTETPSFQSIEIVGQDLKSLTLEMASHGIEEKES